MTDVINFYSTNGEFGGFSNFSRHPIKYDGETWKTSEAAFQAAKFGSGTSHYTDILKAKGPSEAARMGRDRSRPLRKDWESVKENIMYAILKAKFTQHDGLNKTLLSTGDAKLVEHTENDSYWGDGGNGKCKNRLGFLLMKLREELRDGH